MFRIKPDPKVVYDLVGVDTWRGGGGNPSPPPPQVIAHKNRYGPYGLWRGGRVMFSYVCSPN